MQLPASIRDYDDLPSPSELANDDVPRTPLDESFEPAPGARLPEPSSDVPF